MKKLKLKANVLDMINYLLNLSITCGRNEEDDLWIVENSSQRRFIFKASHFGQVNVFFKDTLILTYNKDCSVSTHTVQTDSLNFLLSVE